MTTGGNRGARAGTSQTMGRAPNIEQSGDPDARRFEALFHANYPSVLAYALRRADRQVAEDVVSETFAVAWRRLGDVPSDELPWLYGVARRTLANQRRSERRRSALIAKLRHEAPTAAAPRDIADTNAEHAAVVAALDRLSERDR